MRIRDMYIKLVRPISEPELHRMFPKPVSKRKSAFKIIMDEMRDDGMPVSEWLSRVNGRSDLTKVDLEFLLWYRSERNLITFVDPPRE